MASDELIDEFGEVWAAALDASTSRDFRLPDGSLNEEAYLRYRRSVITRAVALVDAAEQRGRAAAIADLRNDEQYLDWLRSRPVEIHRLDALSARDRLAEYLEAQTKPATPTTPGEHDAMVRQSTAPLFDVRCSCGYISRSGSDQEASDWAVEHALAEAQTKPAEVRG